MGETQDMSDPRMPMVAWLTTLILLAGPYGAPSGVSAQATPGEGLPVVEHTLDNGMRLLILPQTTAPTVSFVVQYEVGSVNEVLGATGIAHLLEHLLFKGTTTIGTRNYSAEQALFAEMDLIQDTILMLRSRGGGRDTVRIGELNGRIRALEDSARTHVVANEFDLVLSRAGARSLNATTESESTTYFVELPSNRVELWFVMEADRMRNPVFREFYSERDVVAEERRMRVDTQPFALTYQEHLATAYRLHPYGVPVVGYPSDLQSLTRRQVADYYRRYYGPNNAVVSVVGDVDPDQVIDWAEEYFGGIPSGAPPRPVLAREPEQRGERRTEIEFDAEPLLLLGWHVVDGRHEDMPALVMLTSLLTGGRTSRLYQRLVRRERLATSVTSSMGPGSRFAQLFSISAVPRAPHGTEDIEAVVYEELDRLATQPPDDLELQRVRNQVEAGNYRRLTSNLGLALQLAGSASLFGDWRASFRFSRRLQAVNPADVSRVVRTYFTRRNRTVATLVTKAAGR
ncbi:MAG: pitrilysin family protein [Gemmatimonadota bacterium]|nr:MAG: pitrilysin family protein [Gemmatimonadota bacterium]